MKDKESKDNFVVQNLHLKQMNIEELIYEVRGQNVMIDELCINQALMEFGVNGDKSGVALFVNLIIAELGINPRDSWEDFLKILDETNPKNA